MNIVIAQNQKGTLKISQLVLKKFIYKILSTANYQLDLIDIDVQAQDNNIVVVIKNDSRTSNRFKFSKKEIE